MGNKDILHYFYIHIKVYLRVHDNTSIRVKPIVATGFKTLNKIIGDREVHLINLWREKI